MLFWYLDNFLEKDKTGLPLQINITWSVFIGLIKWRDLHLSNIWTFQWLRLNVKVYIRFIVFVQTSFCFFICWQLCWIRGLRTGVTSSCFLFPVGGGRVKRLTTGGLKKFRTGGLPFLLLGGSVPYTCHLLSEWYDYKFVLVIELRVIPLELLIESYFTICWFE